ncbi:LysM domain-containing protein [Proteiniclasticum sp.]|uniref:LysM peptidoglycan-binding domain-containing protein n=1 Tax=Proteiniclasticum sp. TaxID=2053595 RepID=UPI0028983E35|nr:LysM domain-containing protein [Proteiniclasticum sp.]
MARDKQTNARKKRFTTRETVLLLSLVVVAVIYFYTNYFFLPTLDKISQTKVGNDTLMVEYNSRIALISQKDQLADQLEENNRLYNTFKTQYYKTTNQEHFIKVLELDFIDNNDLNIASLSFNQAMPLIEFNSTEESAVSLHSSIVTFPYEGSYEGLIELIRRLENNKQLIRINSLDIIQIDPTTTQTEGVPVQTENQNEVIYQGNITIEFFIIPQEYRFPWNVGVPQYDKASTYEGSLFFYDDGGLVPAPVVEEVEEPVTTDPEDPDETDEPVEETPVEAEEPDDTEEPDEVDDTPKTYIVKPGDTLFSISMRFYGSQYYVDDIMLLNGIEDVRFVPSGLKLRLPAVQ